MCCGERFVDVARKGGAGTHRVDTLSNASYDRRDLKGALMSYAGNHSSVLKAQLLSFGCPKNVSSGVPFFMLAAGVIGYLRYQRGQTVPLLGQFKGLTGRMVGGGRHFWNTIFLYSEWTKEKSLEWLRTAYDRLFNFRLPFPRALPLDGGDDSADHQGDEKPASLPDLGEEESAAPKLSHESNQGEKQQQGVTETKKDEEEFTSTSAGKHTDLAASDEDMARRSASPLLYFVDKIPGISSTWTFVTSLSSRSTPVEEMEGSGALELDQQVSEQSQADADSSKSVPEDAYEVGSDEMNSIDLEEEEVDGESGSEGGRTDALIEELGYESDCSVDASYEAVDKENQHPPSFYKSWWKRFSRSSLSGEASVVEEEKEGFENVLKQTQRL